jgi:hypothetical protein
MHNFEKKIETERKKRKTHHNINREVREISYAKK